MNKRKSKNSRQVIEKKLDEVKQIYIKKARRTETEPLPEKVLLRVSEVAQYFDVDERTVRTWIQHGHLDAEYTPGGQKRITKESVDKCRFNRSATRD